MNHATAKFIAYVSSLRHVDELSIGDAMEIIGMVQRGDLVHIDTLAAVAEAQGYRLEPVVVPLHPARTADAVWDAGDYGQGAI